MKEQGYASDRIRSKEWVGDVKSAVQWSRLFAGPFLMYVWSEREIKSWSSSASGGRYVAGAGRSGQAVMLWWIGVRCFSSFDGRLDGVF
jgi:hypothetical protein